ncbi:LytR/AlgR family response regulator transcription factor [Flavivirga rizhaonensis]|uniref:LytTR family transcriptional regulator n=1 Tax=Flavivirga rizhaonensis TaxID=2559571 RepID=A0A4S1DUU1_9FLAO|nr:LytTR family DNA-binding domain-containing protein [Flavivirga rizhaonensis]TGV01807.1 LytTR family transcriptional regulator [Flavivirga rizhaonensis]
MNPEINNEIRFVFLERIDDFEEVMKRMKNDLFIKNLDQKIRVFMCNINVESPNKRITIDTSEGTHVLNVSDILYCEADVNYTYVHTIKSGKITSSKTLKTYENLLLENDFYRVHQSYLVNLEHVKKYTKGKLAYLILSNGSRVKVSLSNKAGFLKKLKNVD